MHEHDRDLPVSMGAKHEKAVAELSAAKIAEVAGAKARDLEVPNRCSFQHIGKSDGYFVLDRHVAVVDFYRLGRIRVVDLLPAAEFPGRESPAGVIKTKEGRNRNLKPRWNTLGLLAGRSLNGLKRGDQWRSDTGTAVTVAQTTDFKLGGRDKVLEAKAGPYQFRFVEFDCELTEGQFKLSALE
jgi:hypothetical protein